MVNDECSFFLELFDGSVLGELFYMKR